MKGEWLLFHHLHPIFGPRRQWLERADEKAASTQRTRPAGQALGTVAPWWEKVLRMQMSLHCSPVPPSAHLREQGFKTEVVSVLASEQDFGAGLWHGCSASAL